MEFWKPLGRAFKYRVLHQRAERRAARAIGDEQTAKWPQAAFLIGCGRSGTTIVGDIFNQRPDVCYFFEPYHIWAAIDPTIDVLKLYHQGISKFLLDSHDCTPEARLRFNRLLMQPARAMNAPLMIEKTPFNAVRIGFLETVAQRPKFLHLVRDGVDVARSIERLSRDHTYRIAGRAALNRWWGVSGCKWTSLAEEGIRNGYFPDEVHLLRTFEAKGAYEWIVSIGEVDRWRERLGDRLLEIKYDRLTGNPKEALSDICAFLSLENRATWMDKSVRLVESARHNDGPPVVLPPKICRAFNELQERFGFSNRAVEGMPEQECVSVAMISNEPTPYRVHVLNRLARELENVSMHNVFTHTISNPSMPWQMEIGPELKPVFFPRHHLLPGRPVALRSYALFKDIRKYLKENEVRMVILLGYNDLTRLALIRWAHRTGLPIILAGDSNIFAEGRLSVATRLVKRHYVRWVLNRISALMPMGTCGRAFFRLYKDHNLPEFLFPYEPDYAGLKRPNSEKLIDFKKAHGLEESRKRLLYCGRLAAVKRVDVLIDAFMRMATARPEWDLVIAGDGPLKQQLVSRVPHVLRHRIKWLGFLQFQETVLCYHSCDVLVHPSEYEPWALVINEAVACNLPIISTAVVGASVELVHHGLNGLIVPPRNIEAMTEAILEITAPGVVEEMREHCPDALRAWQLAADPVQGVRLAARHFGLIWKTPSPKLLESFAAESITSEAQTAAV